MVFEKLCSGALGADSGDKPPSPGRLSAATLSRVRERASYSSSSNICSTKAWASNFSRFVSFSPVPI